MKKIIFICMLLSSFSAYSQDGSGFLGTLKLDVDLPGTSTITDVYNSDSLSGEQNIDLGFSFSMETSMEVTDYLSLGIGLSYQFRRDGQLGFPPADSTLTSEEQQELNDKHKGKFGYIPVYALAKFTIIKSEAFSPAIVGHIGYNLFYGDNNYKGDILLSGGLYYGFGIVLDYFEDIQFGLLYKTNYGSGSHAEEELYETKYSYLSLSLGINLR